MKTLARVFSTLIVITMLLFVTAAAQSGEQDLYAPFTSDTGPISIQALYPGDLYDDDVLSETQYCVMIELSASWDFYSEVEGLDSDMSGMFYLVSLNGFLYTNGFTLDEEADGNMCINLFFYLPAGSELAEYRLVYDGQMRMLAETGSEPELAEDTGETAVSGDSGTDETVVSEPDETELADEDDSPETIDIILEALGEPIYQTTYEDLAKGNVILKDDKSGSAKGLQTLLLAFGYDVSTDGLADKKTFNPLHNLQAIFGMEVNNTVDAEDFSFLLKCLYIMNDPDGAEELLAGAEFTYDEFYYLLGCCAELQELYYTAYEYFDYCSGEDAYNRAQACIRPWPDNGELYHNKNYVSSQMQLNIQVDNQDEGYASYFKIYSGDGDWACSLFVYGSGTVSTSLPGGVYTIKLGTGEDWFGVQEAFGYDGYYETLLFSDDTAEVALESGYEYTLTINTSQSDPEADDVDSEYTDFGDF